MRLTKNKLVAVFLFLLTQTYCAPPQLTPQEACGFYQNNQGQRVSWKANTPVKIYVDPAFPSEYRSALIDAMNTWNQQIGKNILVFGGERGGTQQRRDNINMIYWITTGWDQSTKESREEQANTTTHYIDNQLVESDMQINAMNFTYSINPIYNEIDLQSVLLHELGHVLGLKHNVSEPSVMATKLQAASLRRNLYSADLMNSKCEY